MYAEKEIQTSLLLLDVFAALRYIQKIRILTVLRIRVYGLILYYITI